MEALEWLIQSKGQTFIRFPDFCPSESQTQRENLIFPFLAAKSSALALFALLPRPEN